MPHHQWHLQVKMKVNTPTPPNPTCKKKTKFSGAIFRGVSKNKAGQLQCWCCRFDIDKYSSCGPERNQKKWISEFVLKLCNRNSARIKTLSCTQSPGHERFATENRTAEFHSWYDFEALQRISDTSVRASVMEPMNKIAIIHKLCSFTIRIQQFVQKALRSINSRERKETPFSVKAKEQIEIVLSQQHGPQKFMDLWSKSITIHVSYTTINQIHHHKSP